MKKSLLLASFLCAVCAAGTAMAEQTRHQPGFKIAGTTENPWILTPSVSFGVFWETNAHDSYDDEESGAGYRIQPKISLTNTGLKSTFGLNAFYTLERGFDSKDGEDSDSYGLAVNFQRKLTKHQTLTLAGSYIRMEDDDFYEDGNGNAHVDPDKTEHYNANASWGWKNDRWQFSIGGGWSRTHYLSDSYRSSYSNDSYHLLALAGRAYAQNHYWNLSVSTTIDDPEDGDTSQSYYIMTGSSGNVSKNLSYSAMVGVSIYDYSGKYDDDTDVGPSYSGSLSYRISRIFSCSLTASSQYKADNADASAYYTWSHQLVGSLNAQWWSELSSRLNVAGIIDQHNATGASYARDYDRRYARISFTTSYQLNQYASIYGGISYKWEDYSGTYDSDKDNFRVDLGMTFTL